MRPSDAAEPTPALAELDGGVLLELRQPVVSDDEADGAGLRPHYERLRRRAAVAEADAAQQFTGGDSGGGEEAIVTGHQIVGGQYLVEVVTSVDRSLALGVVA